MRAQKPGQTPGQVFGQVWNTPKPLGNHSETTRKPLGNRSETTRKPLANHSETTRKPLGTRSKPLGNRSGITLREVFSPGGDLQHKSRQSARTNFRTTLRTTPRTTCRTVVCQQFVPHFVRHFVPHIEVGVVVQKGIRQLSAATGPERHSLSHRLCFGKKSSTLTLQIGMEPTRGVFKRRFCQNG